MPSTPGTTDRGTEKELQRLRRLPENKICPNCGAEDGLGFTAVCWTFKTFVCGDCKSAHQSFSHRCKSTAMSIWTAEEVKAMDAKRGGGNAAARALWLANVPESQRVKPDSSLEAKKAFVQRAYIEERWKASAADAQAAAAGDANAGAADRDRDRDRGSRERSTGHGHRRKHRHRDKDRERERDRIDSWSGPPSSDCTGRSASCSEGMLSPYMAPSSLAGSSPSDRPLAMREMGFDGGFNPGFGAQFGGQFSQPGMSRTSSDFFQQQQAPFQQPQQPASSPPFSPQSCNEYRQQREGSWHNGHDAATLAFAGGDGGAFRRPAGMTPQASAPGYPMSCGFSPGLSASTASPPMGGCAMAPHVQAALRGVPPGVRSGGGTPGAANAFFGGGDVAGHRRLCAGPRLDPRTNPWARDIGLHNPWAADLAVAMASAA